MLNSLPSIFFSNSNRLTRWALLILLVFPWTAGNCNALQGRNQTSVGFGPSESFDHSIEIELLDQIEAQVLPSPIQVGPARFADLPSYYWSENQELRSRFAFARQQYESPSDQPFRELTLVAGSAGVGKTFIKQNIFSKEYPADSICKFDVKELLESWKAQDAVEDRPDLFCGDVILSRLPALKGDQPPLLRQYLEAQSACFFVIDSLDEVHPDSYETVLTQIEQFVKESDRSFLHVVVLGRPLSFRNYWKSKYKDPSAKDVSLFMLHPPQFRTTGDLMVSSWNYHTWKHKLRWRTSNGDPEVMPLEAYSDWVQEGYPESFLNHQVSYHPNRNMDARVHDTVQAWAMKYPVINSMLSNLAGNGMIREIAEDFALHRRPFDEREIMERYLAKWLERHTKCENRPSSTKPEHLDLYLQLVECVAIKYIQENEVDANGFFAVHEEDHIEVVHEESLMRFPVLRILDRSGLKYLDPRKPGESRYRFEPIWLHRLLIAKYDDLFPRTKR